MGFLREGWHELRRKLERNKLRRQLRQQEHERNAALTRLGQRAWEDKLDLSADPELRDQLSLLEGRASQLTAATKDLEGQRSVLEERRRSEVAKFDGQRRAIEEKKRPVDAALRDAREKQAQQETTIKRLEARQAALVAELAALEHQLASPPAAPTNEQQAQLTAAQNKRQQLFAERPRLSEELSAARASLPALMSEINRLAEESHGYATEIGRVESDRNTLLTQMDGELSQVRAQLSATSREAGAVEQERAERFLQLGSMLYDRKVTAPALAEFQTQVTILDRTREATRLSLQASFAATQAMPSGTMLKFAAVLLLAPVLLVGLGYGVYWGWNWWQERQPVEEVEINPYLSHPLSGHPAYRLADQLWEAQDEQSATTALKELFRALGLGIYTPDGAPVLAGSERRAEDFFLYDFQVGILARAMIRRNGTLFREYANALEQNVRLATATKEIPFARDLLVEGLHRRYQQAAAQPNDPRSFLPLVVDGLARHHSTPTSLQEFDRHPADEFLLDPVQTFLVSLDIFVQPERPQRRLPAPTASAISPLSWLESTVYAASPPCDKILGDPEKEGYWGTFLDGLGELLESLGLEGKVGTKITKGVGRLNKGADVAQLAILKYGITLTVTAEPPKLHLHHTGSEWEQIKLTAKVEFDPGKIPEGVIKCGWLSGANIPRPGPVPDVTVEWSFQPSPQGVFEAHPKTLQAGRQVGSLQKTDSQGKSEYLLLPLYCKEKKGQIKGRNFRASVSAQILSAGPTAGLDIISGTAEYVAHWFGGLFHGETKFRGEWHEKKPPDEGY